MGASFSCCNRPGAHVRRHVVQRILAERGLYVEPADDDRAVHGLVPEPVSAATVAELLQLPSVTPCIRYTVSL
jgi:hypothetical protein